MIAPHASPLNHSLFCCKNNSCLGSKHAGYRHICRGKNQVWRAVGKQTSPDSVKIVGGAEDVILKIPGLAGFQMKVKANSVTFPDGSRTGTLIVSPVTADKLPMSPPAGGAQFGVPAWTIQPAGTRFDPPIEVTLPNASSQPVGDNLPIVQWDHDLGQYVAMGRATVSEDGAVLVTDSGSGITKAGWGGACIYEPDKCGKTAPPPECDKCKKLEAGTADCPSGKCVADAAQDGDVLPPVLSTQLEWSKPVSKDITELINALAKGRGSPVSGSINLKGKITAKQQNECCSSDPSGQAQTKILSGTGEIELEWKVTPPWSALAGAFGEYIGLAELDILAIKVKAYAGAGGTGSYKGCSKDGDLIVTASAGITGELAIVDVGVPAANPILKVSAIAGVTGAYTCKFSPVSTTLLQGSCPWQATLFVKGDVKADTRKWTGINLAYPLSGTTVGTIDY